MLLVARRVGEALRIGTNIEVKVVAATRSRVMLAVTAPRELDIRRIYGKSDYKNVDLDTGESGEMAEAAPDAEEAEDDERGNDPTASKGSAGGNERKKQLAGE